MQEAKIGERDQAHNHELYTETIDDYMTEESLKMGNNQQMLQEVIMFGQKANHAGQEFIHKENGNGPHAGTRAKRIQEKQNIMR